MAKELTKQINSLETLLKNDNTRQRFNDMLKDKAPAFISSILSVVNNNTNLKTSNPNSIISAAFIAASLDLPINQNLGFAYIIPYKNIAQFQMGYKGFVQLAMRTGKYKTIHCTPVYEGEIESCNNFTGEMEFNSEGRFNDNVVGYCAYFKMINGFEKYLYMTVEELKKHGKKFSQSYKKGYGLWVDDFPSMALKTVLKRLLSKYGMLSTEMQIAVRSDQATITTEGKYDFIDNPVGESKKEDTETPKAKKIKPDKKTAPKEQKEPAPDEDDPISPKDNSKIRNMLSKLNMTEESYLKNKKISDLGKGEAVEVIKDLAKQLNKKLEKK